MEPLGHTLLSGHIRARTANDTDPPPAFPASMSSRDTDTQHERANAGSHREGIVLTSLATLKGTALKLQAQKCFPGEHEREEMREEMGFCARGRGGGRPARSCGAGGAGHGDPPPQGSPWDGAEAAGVALSLEEEGSGFIPAPQSFVHTWSGPYDWPYTGILSSALSPKLSPKKRGAGVSGCLWLWARSPSVPCGVGHQAARTLSLPARQPCRGSHPRRLPVPSPWDQAGAGKGPRWAW